MPKRIYSAEYRYEQYGDTVSLAGQGLVLQSRMPPAPPGESLSDYRLQLRHCPTRILQHSNLNMKSSDEDGWQFENFIGLLILNNIQSKDFLSSFALPPAPIPQKLDFMVGIVSGPTNSISTPYLLLLYFYFGLSPPQPRKKNTLVQVCFHTARVSAIPHLSAAPPT